MKIKAKDLKPGQVIIHGNAQLKVMEVTMTILGAILGAIKAVGEVVTEFYYPNEEVEVAE